MVAITVVSFIVGLLLLDLVVQYAEARFAARPDGGIEMWNLVATSEVEAGGDVDFPPGLFLDRSHAWARLEPDGTWRVGVDGAVAKALGKLDQVVLAEAGQKVKEGEPLAMLRQGLHVYSLRAPVGGEVVLQNEELSAAHVTQSPYGHGWLCTIRPVALAADTRRMVVGDDATRWHRSEAGRIAKFLAAAGDAQTLDAFGADERARFQRTFLDAR
jgi:glycine cleavage system H protein